MSEQVRPDEAAKALAQIRDRQEQVINVTVVPVWYWWAVGALMVGFAAAVDTRRPAVVGVGIGVFVIGILACTGWVVRRALQVQVRGGLLGARGILLILGFVAVVVGASLAVAFSLQAAGVPGPALAGNAFGAACLVVGGPLLMGALRRIMLANRTGGTR